MGSFSADIKFKFPWRKYQQRVLDELELHIEDDHLHVIAPPGSGKTVLGLEVMLRLDKPTLILAPTLAIRNQWIQRFCDLFLQVEAMPDWISKDIRKPSLITVVTYQGLHSACNDVNANKLDFEDETDVKTKSKSNFRHLKMIVASLRGQGVETFILDESHHLKNEWWQTLTRLKHEMKPKIVGLTATPPYDVSALEWHRYIELNGVIDVEISVPELMAEGDLCPHQDFVYFTSVNNEELQKIVKIRNRIRKIYSKLKNDSQLVESILKHPIIQNPLGQEFYIFDNIDFYSACLIFLKDNDVPISPIHLQVLGLATLNEKYIASKAKYVSWEDLQFPVMEEKWLEIILEYALFESGGYFENEYGDVRKELLEKLKHAGVIERRSVCFSYNPALDKRISSSITKLDAIAEIVNIEYAALKHDLRQVILTDYVRKEYLVNDVTNELTLKRIGVMSIFEQLRRQAKSKIKLGVLTGTLVIIPEKAYPYYLQVAATFQAKNINFSHLTYDKSYLKCTIDDKNRDQMVYLITQLFQQGHIEVLIGTKALLGEGWDAPSINSLILATVVGSFVSSNQMRGRAIRTSALDPNKASNIWHIACVDPSVDNGGVDVDLIERRFRNFVGISEDADIKIQNGIARLKLYENEIEVSQILAYNSLSIGRAQERNTLRARWELAIPNGTELVEEIKIPYFEPSLLNKLKTAQMQKTVQNMIGALAGAVMFFVEMSTSVFNSLGKALGVNGQYGLMALIAVGTVFFGRRAMNTYSFYIKYRDVSKDIYKIGNTLLQTLCKNKIFTTSIQELKVLTFSDDNGYVYCHLDNGTTYEKSLFVQMIQEIVDPIYNPRYIIVRKNILLNVFKQYDYHAVPEVLAKKAALAKDFLHFWQINVGEAQLMFTKSIEGCKFLIQSRMHALSNHQDEKKEVEHVNTWR